MKVRKNTSTMEIVNPDAARIDIVNRPKANSHIRAAFRLNRITKGQQYVNPEGYLFLDQKKLGLVKRIKKQIAKFELTNEELGFVTS